MFRLIASKTVQQQRRFMASRVMSSSSTAAAAAPVPSVKDLLIDLTFVDPSGARRKAKGIIGKSLFLKAFCWYEVVVHLCCKISPKIPDTRIVLEASSYSVRFFFCDTQGKHCMKCVKCRALSWVQRLAGRHQK